MSLFDYFRGWFNKEDKPDYSEIVFVNSLADVPKKPEMKIYIVTDGIKNKWVVFRCPDNCGRRVEASLMKSTYPNWNLKIKKKKVSLSPSVVVNGCNAHFWLTNSKIYWAKFENE